MKIEYITCPNGDWVVLKVQDKEYYSGHSVPDFVWLTLLNEQPGTKMFSKEVSDKDMEEGNY